MQAKLRPKYLFIILLVSFYVVLASIDLVHETARGVNLFDLGNIFLAQFLAIFITTAAVILNGTWRKHMMPWLATSAVSILLIAGSLFIFYKGPRIVSEADGPASVLYGCMISEHYDTITNLTGETTDYQSTTAKLCVLKNMPLAASNILYVNDDTDLSEVAVFMVSEVLLRGSFIFVRKLL